MSRFAFGLVLQMFAASKAEFSKDDVIFWNSSDPGFQNQPSFVIACDSKGVIQDSQPVQQGEHKGKWRIRWPGVTENPNEDYYLAADVINKAVCRNFCCKQFSAKLNLDKPATGTSMANNALCCQPTCKSYRYNSLTGYFDHQDVCSKKWGFKGRLNNSDDLHLPNETDAAFQEVCCDRSTETCADAKCPEGYLANQTMANMTCADSTCNTKKATSADTKTCCYKLVPGLCKDHMCPKGSWDKAPTSKTSCKGHLTCDLSSQNATDYRTCCAPCDKTCPANNVLAGCGPESKSPGVCKGKCGFHLTGCPEGWKFRVGSNDTLCAKESFCSTASEVSPDTPKCCEKCTAENPCPTTTTTQGPSTTQGSTSQGSGASSSSGGASATTTKKASSTPQKDTTVEGAMTTEVTLTGGQDLATFVKDPNVKQGFADGIATRLEVQSPDTVTITSMSIVSGRRLSEENGKIKVDFLVTLKGMKPIEDFRVLHNIESSLSNAPIDQERMAAAIKKAVEAKTGKTLDVEVKELKKPTITKGTGESSGSSSSGSSGGSSLTSAPVSSAHWQASLSTALWMIAAACMASNL